MIKEIQTVEEFQQTIENTDNTVIVDFYAPWCGPCRMVGTMLKKLSEEQPELNIIKVNIDELSELSVTYSVRNIPTILVIKNGEINEKIVGAVSQDNLMKKLV